MRLFLRTPRGLTLTDAGIFDETMLNLRGCTALELMRVPVCCAVSIYPPLAQKKELAINVRCP